MADIFVSYSKKDKKRVGRLVERLEGEGWTVFWDTHLLSGDAWARRILVEIESARCVLVVWSRMAVASEWVGKEADIAQTRGIMIPATLDGTLPPPGFRGVQAENIYWWGGTRDNAALKRLLISVSRKLNPNDPLSKIPPPDDEPWIRLRHLIAAVAIGACALAGYHYGYDPYYAFMRGCTLAGVRDWGYQLQKVEPKEISLLNPHDMLVIDYSKDGTQAGALTKEEIRDLKTKPDGSRRVLLAYLSVGEAEEWRFYWNKDWVDKQGLTGLAPSWIAQQNVGWDSYNVKYWDPGWKEIVFSGPNSFLKLIKDQGFDGVYLAGVNSYIEQQEYAGMELAATEMIKLVAQLSKTVRTRDPSFLIVAQNAHRLLVDEVYLSAIDGVALQDLIFSMEPSIKWIDEKTEIEPEQLNPFNDIREKIGYLRYALKAGKSVFVVEYEESPRAEYAKRGLEGNGFKTTLATRLLTRSSGYQRLREMSVAPITKPTAPPAASPLPGQPTTAPSPSPP